MKKSRGLRCAESFGVFSKLPFTIEKRGTMYVMTEESEKNGEKFQTLGISDEKTGIELLVVVNDEVREVLRELLDGKVDTEKVIARYWEEKK